MNDYLNNLLLGYLPYIAMAVFVAGVWYHWRVSNRTVQATSTQFLRSDRNIRWGSALFHYAILMVLAGHIFGLLTPEWLYRLVMTDETKRLLAIVMGSASGLLALVGITMLLYRRFADERVRAGSTFQDYFIALLIWVQIVLGLLGTYETARGPIEDYMALDHWAQGLVLFEPDAWRYIADAEIVYKLHIINGFLICLLFPYTKLMHMVAAPFQYLFNPNR